MSHTYQNDYFMNTISSYFLDVSISLKKTSLFFSILKLCLLMTCKSHFMCIFFLLFSVGAEFCRRLVNSSLGT